MPLARFLRSARLGLMAIVVIALAGCATMARPPAPPVASIQKLALGADGSLALELRIQNYAQKAVHFATLDSGVEIGGIDAGTLHVDIGFDIPGRNSEVVAAKLVPNAAAKVSLQRLLAGSDGNVDSRHEVRYQLKGTIVSDKPSGRYPFEHGSALSPVPGVSNEYR